MSQNYYIGVDMGTNSVGWAVTDECYNILSYNQKAMWGARLFEEASTAAERRMFRASRRRLERRKWRLDIIKDLFEEEINGVDNTFFARMKDSALWLEDKNEKIDTEYCLFHDSDYTDVDYHREFPTIYHLRTALIKNEKQYDIRLVYLAIHNILKHRGHFLFEGKNMTAITSFDGVFREVMDYLDAELDIQLESISETEFEDTLKLKKLSKTRKKEGLSKLCNLTREDKQERSILGLLAGTTEDLSTVFHDDSLKSMEKSKICFASAGYDDDRLNIEEELGERCELIDKLKALYDWSILAEILEGGELDGKQYLSVSKVNVYEKHKKDLVILKQAIEQYEPSLYKEFFSSDTMKGNYCAYVGHYLKNNKKRYIKKCSKEDFLKTVGSILKDLPQTPETDYLRAERENGMLLPLQISGDNGVIPYQVHKMELVTILENVSAYYPFLTCKDETGFSVADKIIKTFEFRIPYYVGPLNEAHKEQGANCWINRKETGKILPWNFEEKVDLDQSAENFIQRMTNRCTYLTAEDVLPKNSLLYSEYMVLNELNNLKIGENKPSIQLKQNIYQDLFLRHKKVSLKALVDYLKSNGIEVKAEDISGIDQGFNSSLGTYHDFKRIFGDRINNESYKVMLEQIIFWMTIYSDGGKILKRKIQTAYSDVLTQEEIKKICHLKCSGWGKFSRKFLTGIEGADCETGECRNLIQTMRETNDNLMQILSSRYTFGDAIQEENAKNVKDMSEISYENLVQDINVSPAVKRSIWQTIQLVNEIKKCLKSEPTKIFLEMARGPEEKKERKASRKDQLIKLYNAMRKEMTNDLEWQHIFDKLQSIDEREFRIQDVYLYFTQMGKDMYSGKAIDIEDIIGGSHLYDRDHIYPQSKTKDDSITRNLVLVNKNDNKRKSDGIVPADIQHKMKPMWKMLYKYGLITEEKYKRLTRKTPLTEEELAGFISRQIVETRQSTKAAADVLGQLFPNSSIVYVKAKAVADFKQQKVDIVKVRELNDYHHAKDAYLNIVVGNVYDSKFTSNPVRWLKENKNSAYSLNRMFDNDLNKNGQEVWVKGNEGTLKLVKSTMERNDILFTRFAKCNKGGFFDQQQVPAGKGKVPAKANKGTDLSKYGGYNSVKPAYFVLVESQDKKKLIKTIEVVPMYLRKRYENDEQFAISFLEEKYGLKNPRILIPMIKKYSKLVVDGFPVHIAGSTGKQLIMYGAAQLVLGQAEEKYLKKIMVYLERNVEAKSVLKITLADGITEEGNLNIYDELLEKLNSSIYKKRPSNQFELLRDNRDKFRDLELEVQCKLIGEILHLFQCQSSKANLVELGGTGRAGIIMENKKISNFRSVKLVNQSVTGLYEKTVDLLKL